MSDFWVSSVSEGVCVCVCVRACVGVCVCVCRRRKRSGAGWCIHFLVKKETLILKIIIKLLFYVM